MSTDQASHVMSIPECAAVLGVSKDTVYRHARLCHEVAGVPVIPIGRRLFVSRARFESALAGERVAS